MAFLLGIFGWLFRYKPLNWAAFTMILLTLLLHSGVLVARMYISGRPPVTNLYSSALFIGWGAVLISLKIEAIYRNGLGNIAAAVMGYATLQVAYFLGAGGDDNIAVMQAVLDTQFWLATHVVCITLGYASTYLAGLFGLLYVIFGLCTPLLNERSRKELGRMIYGITCFALLFSFYGTVLGGLWADDSWGRFWGWDPKENGALIIVLWNALVLHARWDKMIADRGLAVLAIGGNVVTSWSWFGVNELGIGLHSYGFTEGVLLALGTFVFSQIAIAGLGCLPKSYWWSVQADGDRFGPQAA
jgi:ABC-type transport system involved in cytochrome c biogenesis permease subunit